MMIQSIVMNVDTTRVTITITCSSLPYIFAVSKYGHSYEEMLFRVQYVVFIRLLLT